MSPNSVLRASTSFLPMRMIGGIARQEAQEVALRTEGVFGQPDIERIVDAPVRVHRVVAPVLNPG